MYHPMRVPAHQNFGSGAGLAEPSNFCICPDGVELDGIVYPTSEHAWHAQKLDPRDQHRFAVGGDLASMATGMPLVIDNPAQLKGKLKAWGAKKSGRPEMLGIVAKMAVHPKRAGELGLRMLRRSDGDFCMAEIRDTFKATLRSKYRRNPSMRETLLSTGDAHLVEFGRMAKHKAEAGRPPLWTGQVNGGMLYGQNLMGKLMMEIRKEIINPEAVTERDWLCYKAAKSAAPRGAPIAVPVDA